MVSQCAGEAGQPGIAARAVCGQGAAPLRGAPAGLGGQPVVQAKSGGAGEGGVTLRPLQKRRPHRAAGRCVVVAAFKLFQKG